jgi:hypothetical protein
MASPSQIFRRRIRYYLDRNGAGGLTGIFCANLLAALGVRGKAVIVTPSFYPETWWIMDQQDLEHLPFFSSR